MSTDEDAVDRIIAQWARERPDLDTAAMMLFLRIYRIARFAGERMEHVYSELGLSRADFDVLATLRRSGPPFRLNPKALTASAMITTGGMTGRLDRLERAGHVRRVPDHGDRRAILVELTPQGRTLLDKAVTDGLVEQRAMLSSLSEAEITEMADALRAVLRPLEHE